VVAVTTALCADQVAVAAPAPSRPQVAEIAGRIVTRLTQGLRRVVAATLPDSVRRHAFAGRVPDARPRTPDAPTLTRPPLSPFQFRLPPPAA
jgi:hypothetical protein